MLDKLNYFPRRNIFEETQHLVASFFSAGDYQTDYDDITKSLLTDEADDENKAFYYSLFLLCLVANLEKTNKLIHKIIKSLRQHRREVHFFAEDLSSGELDIDRYIQLNKLVKNPEKQYPLKKMQTTFQVPEYQITAKIIANLLHLIEFSLKQIDVYQETAVIKETISLGKTLRQFQLVLKQRYKVSFSHKDTYIRLKHKVRKRYRNRKIINPIYNELIQLYESLLSLKGLAKLPINKIDFRMFNEKFDDRLFEIWLFYKVALFLGDRVKKASGLKFYPLFKARKENLPAVEIYTDHETYQVWFQNRKRFIQHADIKWAYVDQAGRERSLDAIPDIVVIRINPADQQNPPAILGTPILIDAKNRSWDIEADFASIKPEITHLVYVWDNFKNLFHDEFKAILVAHNPDQYGERDFYHKDYKDDVRIKVMSLQLTEGNLTNIDSGYLNGFSMYLDGDQE
jgi:hypothetical protein